MRVLRAIFGPKRPRGTQRELLTMAFAADPDYEPEPYIDYPEDVRHVMGVAWTRLKLRLSEAEAYNLWQAHSNAWDAMWLDPEGSADRRLGQVVEEYISYHLKLEPKRSYNVIG